MKKAIFLDRDGTINVEKNYLHKIEDFQFEYKVPEALKILKDLGYLLIVVTNQAGIGRGYYTENDLKILNNFLIEKSKEFGGNIQKIYYCPHHPTGGIGQYKQDCLCRKPGNAMMEQAISELNLQRTDSFIVGDKLSDLEAGIKSQITPILVRTGYGKTTEKEILRSQNESKFEIYDSLYDFALTLKNK
ncbi:D-glycero-beta-D-manno-heptose 1,7-bisphosphate 7-phosphatase [Fusobacterium sp. PH5-44]|uniref:D-glycero-beta-D-manno-heptose 1,7-bisphosphate 7-phosphatase n=1 Tax=unclassified Fusobacterium TaxID=2648384 RepID=UPI003D190772